MMSLLGGFVLLWVLFFLLGLVAFVWNIWMMIDLIRRYKEDTGKMLLYLLLVWLIPFGGIVYYFAAVPEPERFVKKSLSRHRGKLIVVGSILLVITIAMSIAVARTAANARKAWDARKAEVEEQFRKAEQDQLRMEKDREKFNQDFEKMKSGIDEFNQDTNSEANKSKVRQVCVQNFYFGVTCKGSVPNAVKASALKELNLIDESQIKEVCGCASQDSINNFYQGR